MKRRVTAGLAVLAVVTGVGWQLATHPEKSTGLQDVSLNAQSEQANPGPANALAGIRIRLSPSDPGQDIGNGHVPQIAVTGQ